MNTHTPYGAAGRKTSATKLSVIHREAKDHSAEIIYLRRTPVAALPMTEFGSGSYHEAAIRAEQPTYKH